MRILVAALLLAVTAAQAQISPAAPEQSASAPPRNLQAVHAQRQMAATANPHATRAAMEMLRAGGSALDAALAAQLVLNLVEPQSSGIGGGAFILAWDERARQVRAYDGRETAPRAASADRFVGTDGRPDSFEEAVVSGKSVGVPGLLRVMELAHGQHGRLTWARLFEPAVRLAQEGFAVSPRLHALLRDDPALRADAAARALYYTAAGEPLPVGQVLKNPALAEVLRRVAAEGPDAFYRGPVAAAIVAAVRAHPRPGDLTADDLAGYRAKERPPLCGQYRRYRLCGMPPPSSGGIGVLALLGILEHTSFAKARPGSSAAVHYFAEAGRLTYADRDHYVADPDFEPVPTAGLVDREYLSRRAQLVRAEQSMGRAKPGRPPGAMTSRGADATVEAAGTSHISVVDAEGNAVAMTTTIESQFGSRILVHGFLLNNQLTDFSLARDEEGRTAANRVAPNKRPRSTMAPTLVFDADGRLAMTLGSPGGSGIINYVAKTLVGVIDWGMDIQQAISAPNMGSRNRQTELEKGTAMESAAAALKAMGHPVAAIELTSGLQGIVVTPAGLVGGADPRREGLVLGE